MNEDLFFRALKCHYSLLHFFHGVIGGLHGRQVIKQVGDRWHAVNLAAIYPDIKRLPPEGIAAAREFAQKRQAAQQG